MTPLFWKSFQFILFYIYIYIYIERERERERERESARGGDNPSYHSNPTPKETPKDDEISL